MFNLQNATKKKNPTFKLSVNITAIDFSLLNDVISLENIVGKEKS